MDSTTLLSRDQIQIGEELLRFLPSHGLPITGAAWAHVQDERRPLLYIVSPDLTADPLAATRRFVDAFREIEPTWIDPFRRLDSSDVRLLSPYEPLAKGIHEALWSYPDGRAKYYRGRSLGVVPTEEAYVYPTSLFTAPAAPTSPAT